MHKTKKNAPKELNMPKNPRDGMWYWLVLVKPTYYFFAKGAGKEAEEQADAALEDLGPIAAGIVTIAVIAGVI